MNSVEKIAVAALLHDIGKFYQRTGYKLPEGYELNEYCPYVKIGNYYTHQHSAYTAEFLKDIVGTVDKEKFIDSTIDDESFENVCSKHHKPSTPREWIVAIADRIASGFEREEFESYNSSDDREIKKLKYYEIPLEGVFGDKNFALKKLDSDSIIADGTKELSKEMYRELWEQFMDDLETLKSKPKENFVRGLDYLLKKYTSFIPSSTFHTKANIPLYDHLKTSAAFASALAKYHENSMDIDKIRDYKEKKFLLIAGDFFGIQNFIFSDVPTSKASKILRGRSAFIQIFIKVVALKICKDLGLSELSIISTNAGKFEILASNGPKTIEKLYCIQDELNEWFIKNTFGESGIGISYKEASAQDFTSGNFQKLREELAKKVELTKYKKFDLVNQEPILSYDEDKIKDNEHLCKYCNKRFVKDASEEDNGCDFCNIFIKLGEKLAKRDFIKISTTKTSDNDLEIFSNYYIRFIDKDIGIDEKTVAVFDISKDEEFKGYEKWPLKSYVKSKENKIVEFEELADMSCKGGDKGVKALMSLKGDVDNMGDFLSKGNINSFAKYNFISRLIDYFFSVKVSKMMDGKNLYTIFAGGDDLFVIGAWDEVIDIAKKIRNEFMDFVEGSKLSISMGLVMFKPTKPINFVANISEKALEDAKALEGKNGITLFGESVKWGSYLQNLKLYDELEKADPNTTFTYRLRDIIEMSKRVKYSKPKEFNIEDTLWRSKLTYSFTRNMDKEDESLLTTLNDIVEKYPKEAKMVVDEFIYKRRDAR